MRDKKNRAYSKKKHNDGSKPLLTSNYFKFKWIKLFNKKAELGRMDKKT